MIFKRIRKGPRQSRGSVARIAASVEALSRYVLDADPWSMAQFERVRSLTDYAMHVDRNEVEPGEKVEASGSFNLQGHELKLWQMQLAAIAMRAPRSRDPVEHFVFSWPTHEHPTAVQVEEAAAIFMMVLGYADCAAIWSQHGNTKNDHGHLAVVRIDPATGQVSGDGWDIDRAHQALAIIEERQGWSSEPNALYVARGGEVFDRLTNAKVRHADGRQLERRSAKQLPPKVEEKAIETRQVIAAASDWFDLHARMAALGVAYRRKGSGAIIDFGDDQIKASAVHPSCSLSKLEKRFGSFQPDPSCVAQRYEGYRHACREQLDQIRQAHQAERAALKIWLEAAIAGLVGTDPVLRAAMRAQYASVLASLDAAFDGAKKAFAGARLSAAEWEGGGQPTTPSAVPLPTLILPMPGATERRAAIPADFLVEHEDWKTRYYDRERVLAFTDLRTVILVHRATPENVDAALAMAAARWGSVRIRARPKVVALVTERARVLGIRLVDQDGRPVGSPHQSKEAKKAPTPSRIASPKANTSPAIATVTVPIAGPALPASAVKTTKVAPVPAAPVVQSVPINVQRAFYENRNRVR